MLGIVILNYQKWEETLECINSIIENMPESETISICIVDNKSTTSIPVELNDLIDNNENIDLLKLNHNYGYSYGNNRGWEFLKNKYQIDYIIISNSDIVFLKNSLQAIVEFYSNGGKGIVFPKIFSPNGKVSYIDNCYYSKMRQIYSRILNKNFFYNKENAINMDCEEPVQTNLNMGACFAMDSKSMNKLLPLDENTTLYFEEMILSYRADKMNIPITYVPHSTVLHKEGKSTGKKNPFAEMCRDESIMYYSRNYIGASKITTSLLYFIDIFKFRMKALKDKRYMDYYDEYKIRIQRRWNHK